MQIADKTFAATCYRQKTVDELEAALAGPPDEEEMRAWSLTEREWRDQIRIAIDALRNDATDEIIAEMQKLTPEDRERMKSLLAYMARYNSL